MSTESRRVWDEITAAFTQAANTFVFENSKVVSEQEHAEALRSLIRYMASAAVLLLESDPARPQLLRTVSPWLNQFMPIPDAAYFTAAIHGDYTYRLAGTRGSARLLHVEVYSGTRADVWSVKTAGICDLTDLSPGENWEITLSRDAQPGRWIPLPERDGMVMVRQYFSDWECELPSELSIERLGVDPPLPSPSSDELLGRLATFAKGVLATPSAVAQMASLFFETDPSQIPFPPLRLGGERDRESQVGFTGMYYGQSRYTIAPDEATLIEVRPPACRYWSFCLTNAQMEAPEYEFRQVSLNDSQTRVDHDGVARIVISATDPGVPNWLDTGGRLAGLVAGRYFEPPDVPIPTMRNVPLAALRDVVAPGTPTVTAEDRSESLRRRFAAAKGRVWE